MHLEQSATPLPTLDPSPEPRLGILHLLMWTACVAFYLGLVMSVRNALGPRMREAVAVYSILHSVGGGTAWAGLVLLAARRWRGMPFPVYPGEYLLVVLGGSLGIVWGVIGAMAVSGEPRHIGILVVIAVILAVVATLALMIWPITRVTSRRWLAVFWALLIATVFCCGGPIPFLSPFDTPGAYLRVLVDIYLMIVVFRDRADGQRYPWTHWLGIATELWLGLVNPIVSVGVLSFVIRR